MRRKIMFREMRRFKQLLPQETAVEILNRNTGGTLALLGDEDYPYAVPISYVYVDGKLYFHSAKTGHKIDAIKKHAKASFTVIDKDQIVPEKYTTYFRSVIAFGKVRLVEDMDEMREIATKLAMKYSPGFEEGIPAEIDSSIKNMAIIELEIEHMTAKEAIELVKMRKAEKNEDAE
jgi:nitroimidazol reductase NimA-like FMN-containing flavoprotein (pyridoxamine 5'-phosphate oxidase superfamily)